MRSLLVIVTAALLGTINSAQAADEFLGLWSSGAKEVLHISKDGNTLQAEFIRENVREQFEKVRFPAQLKDGSLVIKGEHGNLSAKYDNGKQRLVLGGMKAFQRLNAEQAQALINSLEKTN